VKFTLVTACQVYPVGPEDRTGVKFMSMTAKRI